MKNYIKRLFIVACGSILLTGCGDAEEVIFETPEGFLQMVSSSGSVQENSTSEIISTVVFGGPTTTSDITVNYTVTSSDPSRYTVSPASGTLTIPAGEFTADIAIQPIDNFDEDGNAPVTITLLPSSSRPVGVGGEGNVSVSKVVTIIDNDCPIDIDSFVGTYTVAEVFSDGGVNAGLSLAGAFGRSFQMEIGLAPGDLSGTKVVLTNSAGFDTFINDGTVVSFITCEGTIEFDAGDPALANFAVIDVTSTSYNESSNVIAVNGPLGNFGPFEFTLTKQ